MNFLGGDESDDPEPTIDRGVCMLTRATVRHAGYKASHTGGLPIDSVTWREHVSRRMVTYDTHSTGGSVRYGDTDGEDVGDPDATVWIAPRSQTRAKHGCYHTDSDCPHIDPDRFHEVSRERAVGRYDLRECEHCAGTATHGGAGYTDQLKSLLAAAAESAERDADGDA